MESLTKREELHLTLETILESKEVYYQKPTKTMNYPAIVYSKSNLRTDYADNFLYKKMALYEVMFIYKSRTKANESLSEKILSIPYSKLSRTFVNDGLQHDVYQIYY